MITQAQAKAGGQPLPDSDNGLCEGCTPEQKAKGTNDPLGGTKDQRIVYCQCGFEK